jgi:hypothetical protein
VIQRGGVHVSGDQRAGCEPDPQRADRAQSRACARSVASRRLTSRLGSIRIATFSPHDGRRAPWVRRRTPYAGADLAAVQQLVGHPHATITCTTADQPP